MKATHFLVGAATGLALGALFFRRAVPPTPLADSAATHQEVATIEAAAPVPIAKSLPHVVPTTAAGLSPMEDVSNDSESFEPVEEIADENIPFVVNELVNDETQRAVVQNLVQRWAALDSVGALAWVLEQPSGHLRDQLVQRVAFVQVHVAPAEAARLVVEEIPTGPTQIEAAFAVIHQWALTDMIEAAAWVNTFPEGMLRERALRELNGVRYAQKAF